MRIAVDAMGGDHAPHEIVRGAVAGLKFLGPDDQLLLFGQAEQIQAELRTCAADDARIRIEPCSEVVAMDDSPVEAVRNKRDSSIVRLASAAGRGELDAIISAGNTGAFAAACQFKIKPISGVSRPGIAVVMPSFHGPALICDVGANVAPKPHHLYEYARMCVVYAQTILKIPNPAVGLVSIGEEQAKGDTLVKEAHALIRNDAGLRFIGNVEGRDIFGGTADVFICNGFVGNVILKLTEGLAEGLFKTIIRELSDEGPQLAKQFEPIVDRIWKRHDFAEYGGAPLLGINSVAIICHGRSDQRAIYNAVRVATEQLRADLIGTISAKLGQRPKDAA